MPTSAAATSQDWSMTSQIKTASIMPTLNATEPFVALDVDDHPGAEEGGVLLGVHLRRERDPKLKRDKIEDTKRRGVAIACDACGFDFHRTYGERGFEYIECHHRTPLGVTGKVRTQLADLALICSNCHRMIHRRQEWITVEELRLLIEQASSDRR
jgi:5-methylcytosine-specific restriction protein A